MFRGNLRELNLAAPPEVLKFKAGDTCRFTTNFNYGGPAISITLYVAIGKVGVFGFDEILHGSKRWSIPATYQLKTYACYADIYISSAISRGTYDVYAKLMEITGYTDVFSPTYDNIIEIMEEAPPEEFILTTVPAPIGAGRIFKDPNKARYSYGEIVKLTASPYSGHKFSYWDADGEWLGSRNPINFAVFADHTITAHFVRM